MLSTVSGDNAVRRSDTVHPAVLNDRSLAALEDCLERIRFQSSGVNALGHKAIRQHRLQRRVSSAGCHSLIHCTLPKYC